jgi:hypothetical protein
MKKFLQALNSTYLARPLYQRIAIVLIVFSFLIVGTQNLQIFPGAVAGLLESRVRDPKTLPEGVSSYFVNTEDGKQLEVWQLPVVDSSSAAIVFHGNGASVSNFFPYQQFFAARGITSYGFDYRGYGKSTGWPSEKGLYLDSDAVIKFVAQMENLAPEKLIIAGVSIGSGPASYAASRIQPKALILFSPYESLPEAIGATPVFGIFKMFSWYEFPVKQFVSTLKSSCMIVVHGTKDTVIPIAQGKTVFGAYSGSGKSSFIEAHGAGHNDILFIAAGDVGGAMSRCEL